jgi:hypothetical protein
MTKMGCLTSLFVLAFLMPLCALEAQRQTIPEAVAEGAVGSVATIPSGPAPTMADLLRISDIVVTCTLGEPRGYLSDDQRDVYTDYTVTNPVFQYQSRVTAMQKPGVPPPELIITQLGGTVMVNGTKFTHKEPALPPLQSGTEVLLLLQSSGAKYFITGKYFGAFSVADGRLVPLVRRHDFAPEYRNLNVPTAVDTMLTTLRSLVR